ncbi:MAG: bifunctional 4-hydroxy-2-oxoglutarate aldolase/2-dehydro-3-deoxy-phosphogluconate aldolase [Clostridia bacterium]|nr:bifunctional 4-hydroxy-2-oxoglutarate aldolase/2-dehydro-3-deoxy-phosphogluconate aldolase [Clostridia bacterium]
MNVSETIKKYKLVPVVVIKDFADAESSLGALVRGGLPIAEVTFRTACAPDVIRLATQKFPEMLVGAGTVINAEQARQAIECGAKFVVSPGLAEDVAEVCKELGVPYYPGVVTPTEVIKAVSLGLTELKFFPASDFGGLKTIKALSAAFPQVRFMPTGGVNEGNVLDFLAFEKIFACGGSWMMKGSAEEIEAKTKSAMAHIGGV